MDTHCISIANRLGLTESTEPPWLGTDLRAVLLSEESTNSRMQHAVHSGSLVETPHGRAARCGGRNRCSPRAGVRRRSFPILSGTVLSVRPRRFAMRMQCVPSRRRAFCRCHHDKVCGLAADAGQLRQPRRYPGSAAVCIAQHVAHIENVLRLRLIQAAGADQFRRFSSSLPAQNASGAPKALEERWRR